ncbi:MAG TPA: MATE family efflux transporter [Porphyromonadaceae bacterium]|nr:MATE family efflux transporter [Porphyromonadaceae bacterium]
MGKQDSSYGLLLKIREGGNFSLWEVVLLTWQLTYPVVVSQVAFILMRLIDSKMIGSLGANGSASIGLVESTMWLFGGIGANFSAGFCVLVSHLLGANRKEDAHKVLKQSFVVMGLLSLMLCVLGVCISSFLPMWLGADRELYGDSSAYFRIFSLTIPVMYINALCVGMLKSSGEVKIPSVLSVLMCFLNVVFNFLMIYPSRSVSILGCSIHVFGMGWGVKGAAWGTTLASVVVTLLMFYFLYFKSKDLCISGEKGSFLPTWKVFKEATRIGLPMCLQHFMICPVQILIMSIVAPMGACSIAAHSFSITIESICYMPGFGVREAATTLVGQSIGASRIDLMKKFAYTSLALGISIMTLMGGVMYLFAPELIAFLTPVEEIRLLGVEILRIEAFAEPFFGASIVSFGVYVGLGSAIIPTIMQLFSNWGVRLSLSYLFGSFWGLKGVWIAMCLELIFRGILFLIPFFGKGWKRVIGKRDVKKISL